MREVNKTKSLRPSHQREPEAKSKKGSKSETMINHKLDEIKQEKNAKLNQRHLRMLNMALHDAARPESNQDIKAYNEACYRRLLAQLHVNGEGGSLLVEATEARRELESRARYLRAGGNYQLMRDGAERRRQEIAENFNGELTKVEARF